MSPSDFSADRVSFSPPRSALPLGSAKNLGGEEDTLSADYDSGDRRDFEFF